MMTFGLIGQNISYSKSPAIHAYMAPYLNVPFKYEILDVKSEDIPTLINDLKSGKYHGFNITIPFKEEVLKYVDRLTEHAKRIGAVNTIYYQNGRVFGDNTDYEGFKGLLKSNKVKVKKKRVYILGTGGAAKAVYMVLKDLGAYVTVVSRKPNLSDVFSRVIGYQSMNPAEIDIIINATPVGTYPNVNDSPLNLDIVKQKTVIDLVYNPKETQIIKHAKYGIGGIDMLIIQAIHSEMDWLNRQIKIKPKLVKQIKEGALHE